MTFRAVFLAAALCGAASTAAIAASDDHPKDQNPSTSSEGWSDRCANLDAQFDGLKDKYTSTPNFEAANSLHADGISACVSNDSDAGVAKLEAALRKLGVEPAN